MENMNSEAKDSRIALLNEMIDEEVKRIEGLHTQIGKAYCESYSESPAPELAVLVGDVKAAEKKIREHTKELGKLSGVVRCENCGKEVSVHASFCSSCGTSMSAVLLDLAEEDDIICPVCGLATPHGSIYCEKCGTRIAEWNDSKPAAPVKKADRYCPECGMKVENDDLFCPGCGHKM